MAQVELELEPLGAVCLNDFESLARSRLSRMAFDYIAAGAADEATVRDNCRAFRNLRLWPRVLRNVTSVNTRLRLLGTELAAPILLAPVAFHGLVHPDGELATAAGATQARAPLIVSSSATRALEEIAGSLDVPWWFQLYAQPDPALDAALVARASAAGASALCLTVDTPTLGVRNRLQRARFALPQDLSAPMNPATRVLSRFGAADYRPAVADGHPMVWADVERIAALTELPIVLKGILHPDDAEQAVQVGASAIVVSNHGGRNLDSRLATIDALPAVASRVQGRVPILLDGGIRRGTDVFKAIALGATAVLIGRPYLYALAAGGAAGVASAVEILRTELELTMALMGTSSVAQINRSLLFPASPTSP